MQHVFGESESLLSIYFGVSDAEKTCLLRVVVSFGVFYLSFFLAKVNLPKVFNTFIF